MWGETSLVVTLIVTNAGAALSLIYAAGKVVWFISKLNTRVEHIEIRMQNHEKEHDKLWKHINPAKQP